MSFLRTMAALAAGFAAARGLDRFRAMGGMAGVREAVATNPVIAANPTLKKMLEGFGDVAARGGAAVQSGFAALIGAAGGAAATGAEGAAAMVDAVTGTGAATEAMERNARLMIRAMAMAAKADGAVSPEERAVIESHLGEASAEERAFVAEALAAPVDPLALAREVGPAAAAQAYSAAAALCRGDSRPEAEFLAALGAALGLDRGARTAIHTGLGMAPPAA
ncbi:MAG: DUF533 domain-containing protein [Rhodobacteraceae bacterium]|nr:DUF533 domain-containing protein [Paracoccaceae bacterium]